VAQLYAGTSGFAYPSWKPAFYPPDVPAKRFLEHYASRLNSTEINYTFHRLPSQKSLGEWVNATSDRFVFALKAHMKITHVLRLKDCESFLELFFKAIDPLRVVGRLGPVLFQLPPSLKCDAALLADFLELLPQDVRFSTSIVAGHANVRGARPEGNVPVPCGIREAGCAGGDYGAIRLLPAAQGGLHAR
jgi:uncharacterized protein YecE (DUF72 family)